MNNKKLLVITAEHSRFESLEERLAPSMPTEITVSLMRVETFAEASDFAATHPTDLVLIPVDSASESEMAALRFAVTKLSPLPLAAWLRSNEIDLAQTCLTNGAAAVFSDLMTGPDLIVQTLAVVAHRDKILDRLRDLQNQSHITLEAIADAVVCTDSRGDITFMNSAARRLLLCTPTEGIGRPITEYMTLKDVETQEPLLHPAHQVIGTMQTWRLPAGTALLRRDGTEIMVEDCACPIFGTRGELTGVVIVFHDITEAYGMRAEVDYLAWHDFLTGLPNRYAITRHLDQTLAHAAAHHQRVPVLYLDLDKFKSVNDTLGHGVGDKLLISVATRLRGCFRLIDLVGRQGGDEFIVIMAPGSTLEEASMASSRIIAALVEPHDIDGTQVQVGCSTGIAMFPDHGSTAEMLLHHADAALQCAKNSGRNGWKIFTPDLRADAIERRKVEQALRSTITNSGLALFYQPKINLASREVCGCEALVRWNHPDWGFVPPSKFISCAAESGLIIPLGRWVFGEAIRQAQEWQLAGVQFGTIAVNISADELCHPEFITCIREALLRSCIDPSVIQLELTESVLMHDLEYATTVLGQLKALGLSLAIDDFGTGYSSLSYLADFPIDVLKIDRSFVHGIHRAGTRQQALLHGILTLAKTLSFSVVAEGIETAEEERFLMHTGCEIGQGYYYGAPMDVAAFEQSVATNRRICSSIADQASPS